MHAIVWYLFILKLPWVGTDPVLAAIQIKSILVCDGKILSQLVMRLVNFTQPAGANKMNNLIIFSWYFKSDGCKLH